MKGIIIRIYKLLHSIIYTIYTYIIKNSCRHSNGFIPKNEAYAILKNEGYEFKVLDSSFVSLKEETIDLSIIVPVYNAEYYLRKCLNSIMSQQTSYSYEVICVNDGSKDNSISILEEFQQKFPNIVIFNQENAGISAARNKGIELANGKYLAFVDNDDTITDDFVQQSLEIAYANNADLVQSAYSNVSPLGHIKSVDSKGSFLINTFDNLDRVTKVKGFIWSGISRKSLYDNIRFPLGFWYEDMFTRMLLMRKSKVIVSIGKSLYNYLRRPTSAASTLWKPNNIKCIDQLWLPIQFIEYAKHKLGISPDPILYGILLKEWGLLLHFRTRGLSEKIRKAAFSIACGYFQSLGCSYNHPMKLYNMVGYALLNRNYKLWKVASTALLYKN